MVGRKARGLVWILLLRPMPVTTVSWIRDKDGGSYFSRTRTIYVASVVTGSSFYVLFVLLGNTLEYYFYINSVKPHWRIHFAFFPNLIMWDLVCNDIQMYSVRRDEWL